jgi:hypothetical protein
MTTTTDRPIDRAGRRAVGIAVVAGLAVGVLLALPRYGLFSIGTTAFAGLGVMVALGIYAIVVAVSPSTPADAEGSEAGPRS